MKLVTESCNVWWQDDMFKKEDMIVQKVVFFPDAMYDYDRYTKDEIILQSRLPFTNSHAHTNK